jgi:hypothetical protein
MTMVNFTPWTALAGGALIGLAAAGMWWLLGRMAGVAGILGTAIMSPDCFWPDSPRSSCYPAK